MVLTASVMPELGTPAPHFRLQDVDGNTLELDDFDDAPALLVMFIANHCPYTQHILPELCEVVETWRPEGLETAAICASDANEVPEDAPERMQELADRLDLPFRCLIDATQEVAKAYRAACTPDFFLFDEDRTLVYRGRFDDSRPDNDVDVSGDQLRAALAGLLGQGEIPDRQKPSVGCNIKWTPGNEPAYFAEQARKAG